MANPAVFRLHFPSLEGRQWQRLQGQELHRLDGRSLLGQGYDEVAEEAELGEQNCPLRSEVAQF